MGEGGLIVKYQLSHDVGFFHVVDAENSCTFQQGFGVEYGGADQCFGLVRNASDGFVNHRFPADADQQWFSE